MLRKRSVVLLIMFAYAASLGAEAALAYNVEVEITVGDVVTWKNTHVQSIGANISTETKVQRYNITSVKDSGEDTVISALVYEGTDIYHLSLVSSSSEDVVTLSTNDTINFGQRVVRTGYKPGDDIEAIVAHMEYMWAQNNLDLSVVDSRSINQGYGVFIQYGNSNGSQSVNSTIIYNKRFVLQKLDSWWYIRLNETTSVMMRDTWDLLDNDAPAPEDGSVMMAIFSISGYPALPVWAMSILVAAVLIKRKAVHRSLEDV